MYEDDVLLMLTLLGPLELEENAKLSDLMNSSDDQYRVALFTTSSGSSLVERIDATHVFVHTSFSDGGQAVPVAHAASLLVERLGENNWDCRILRSLRPCSTIIEGGLDVLASLGILGPVERAPTAHAASTRLTTGITLESAKATDALVGLVQRGAGA